MHAHLDQAHRFLRLTGFVAAAAVLFAAGAVPGSATAPSGRSVRAKVHAIAVSANGDWSQAGFSSAFSDMDPSMLGYAKRFTEQEAARAVAPTSAETGASPAAVPEFSARALQSLSWDAARLVNASIPFSGEANPAARPFKIRASAEDYQRAVQCLSEAVYYEAAYEPAEGQAAVAQVVLNRLRHPVYPKTVCGVVYQGHELPTGCQFTFTCDGSLARAPVQPLWDRARKVAERALNGYVVKAVGNATHYHADYVVPYWLPSLAKLNKVGTHIFYRWSGGMGLPVSFTGQYAGHEPSFDSDPVALAAAEQAKEDAEVVARVGPVSEPPKPAIQLAEAQVISTAAPEHVAVAGELKLEAPKVKLPERAAPTFAIRPSCQASTLGNCPQF